MLAVEKLPPRIQKIRASTTNKFVRSDKDYGITTTACIEKARYWTESFKQTEGEPHPIRRAKALANYLAKKTLFITDFETVVGWSGHDTTSVPFHIEMTPYDQLTAAIGSKMALTDDEWKEFEQL
jgi:pyruvate-formate lyase